MTARDAHLHPLALYRHAVQHPLAEIAFFETAYAHHNGPEQIGDLHLLREDFCGTAAIAAAFVASDPERQAMGVDLDAPTLAWAQQHTAGELGGRSEDLHLVEADVRSFHEPTVDCVCALNFSTLIYHTEHELKAYFANAYECLNPGGILVLDLFGGPGAQTSKTQTQTIIPDDFSLSTYVYHWEQRAFDEASRRIDCRIHFEVNGQTQRDAFVYDWRLWPPQTVLDLLPSCGFRQATLWSEPAAPEADTAIADGRYVPDADVSGRDEFTCYITARKPV